MCNRRAFHRMVCADRCNCQSCIAEPCRRYARVMCLVGMLSSEPTDHIPDRRHHRQPIESSLQREQELAPQEPPDAMQQRKHTLCLSCHFHHSLVFTVNYASFKPSISLQRLIVPLQHWAQLGNAVLKDQTYLDDRSYEG